MPPQLTPLLGRRSPERPPSGPWLRRASIAFNTAVSTKTTLWSAPKWGSKIVVWSKIVAWTNPRICDRLLSGFWPETATGQRLSGNSGQSTTADLAPD